jgi:hypothetical protein
MGTPRSRLMTGLALADYLTDFGTPPSAARKPVEIVTPAVTPVAMPTVDVGALVDAEVAKVEARLRAEMNDAAEAALNVERARHEIEIAELQAAFGADASARIAAAFEAAEASLTGITTTAAARILSSFLSDELARRSVEQLASRIREATADRDAVRIKVSGPQSMLHRLGAALGPLEAQCDFTEADAFDVTVSIDGALFETRLAEWAAQIGEAMS